MDWLQEKLSILGAVLWILYMLVIAVKSYDQPKCHSDSSRDCDCDFWLSNLFRSSRAKSRHCSIHYRDNLDEHIDVSGRKKVVETEERKER